MQDKAIIFYDGQCAMCHSVVKFVLKRDTRAEFNFSPLGGEQFKKIAEPEVLRLLPDSFFVRDTDGRIYLKAFGLRIILKKLGGFYNALNALLALFPWRFKNYCYDLIAKLRYKLFSKRTEACPRLPPEISKRFLP